MTAEEDLMDVEDQCDAANIIGCEAIEPPIASVKSFTGKLKLYVSICMGTTAIISVFAFLFLIPFVVDPAISTIVADYEEEPITCKVMEHIYSEGLRNCSWASCREGCTTAVLKCHQITVNYSKMPFKKFQNLESLTSVVWDLNGTKFFVNTEGCGYPPQINCSEFAQKYGYQNVGKVFPCYYSKTYPEMVVAQYSWNDNLRQLILSLVVPISLFMVSVTILTCWYCPSCQKNGSANGLKDQYPSKRDINENCSYNEDDDIEEY